MRGGAGGGETPARRHSTWANFRRSNFYSTVLPATRPPAIASPTERMIVLVEGRVAGGEPGDRTLEHGPAARMAGDGRSVAGPEGELPEIHGSPPSA